MFKKAKPVNECPIIMALSLDKTRKRERIVIGEEHQVLRRLNNAQEGDVLYDEVRPLGELLFSRDNPFARYIGELPATFKEIVWNTDRNCYASDILDRLECCADDNDDMIYEAQLGWFGPQYTQYLIIKDSFFPALWHYIEHLRDWGFCICKCRNCGKLFLTTSKRFRLCSPSCKTAFHAREKKYDADYKSTRRRLQNSLNKICENKEVSEYQQARLQSTFRSTCKIALRRKKQIETAEDYNAFVDWLACQEEAFNILCEEVLSNGKL